MSEKTAAADPPVEGIPLPRWAVPVILSGCAMLLFVPAARLLVDLPIYGDDHSSHLAAIRHLIALIKAGESDLFCPTFNLGFPMYLYYQPLPHLLAALAHLLSFGLLSPQLSFNLIVVAAWCGYPLTTYAGMRWLGLEQLAALLAALCAPLVTSVFKFGFTLQSVAGYGLYTQTIAMVIFPLALGATARASRPESKARELLLAAGVMVLLCASHVFYGLVVATAALVFVLCRPTALLSGARRLVALGALVGVSLLYWMIPLLRTWSFAGGWPWGGKERWEGYGAARVAEVFVTGKLFDHGQIPTVSVGLAIGVALVVWRWRESARQRALLVSLALFVFFLMGRATFGHLVDIQPANLGLQLFRYVGAVHAVALPLAGIGLAALLSWMWRERGMTATAVLAAALLAGPLASKTVGGLSLFRTIEDYSIGVKDLRDAARAVNERVERGAPPGRVYAHRKTETGSHLIAALLAHYTDQSLGQSYGLGMHDSLGFFYLEYLTPTEERLLRLYNFRFVLTKPSSNFAKIQRIKRQQPIYSGEKLQLYQVPGDFGYVGLAEAGFLLLGSPRDVRPASRRWIGSVFSDRTFGVIVPDAAQIPPRWQKLRRLRASESSGLERWREGRWAEDKKPFAGMNLAVRRRGKVAKLAVGLNRFVADVELERPSLVVLRVNYHPWWQARVDGKRVETAMVTPSFLAVQAPAGRHRIDFSFRNPPYQKLLFSGTLLFWAGLPLALWWRRRRANGRS